MAPNLTELSLRRTAISNRAFTAIVNELKKLERIDISDCEYIYNSGMRVCLDNNKGLRYI